MLDYSVKQAAEMFQAEPLEQKEITLDGHPGRFVMQRLPDGLVMRLKIYVVGQRLYQLMITTPPEQGATDDQRRFYETTASKFLDSFTLTPARGASVSGPIGPVGEGSVRGAPVSAPKKLPRAPISAGVLNSKAISKPSPAYPAAAVRERVEGVVSVAIVIDEEGKVMAAEAVGGPELLREAAVAAALKSRFSITRLSGQPVKVSGIVTYNFVLR
jgi:TonB family protein